MLDELSKRRPELSQQRQPLDLATRDGVQGVFQLCRELIVYVLGEMFCQEAVHYFADIRRDETSIFHLHVLTIAERRDDRSVCRWPTDSIFFQCLDERCFRKSGWRFGKMLFAQYLLQLKLVTFFQGWQ